MQYSRTKSQPLASRRSARCAPERASSGERFRRPLQACSADALFSILAGAQRMVIVIEHARRRAVGVLELPRSQRPYEGDEAGCAEAQRCWNHVDKHVHLPASVWIGRGRDKFIRRAFKVTMIEDEDMAIAAIIGVTRPANAIGTAMRL